MFCLFFFFGSRFAKKLEQRPSQKKAEEEVRNWTIVTTCNINMGDPGYYWVLGTSSIS